MEDEEEGEVDAGESEVDDVGLIVEVEDNRTLLSVIDVLDELIEPVEVTDADMVCKVIERSESDAEGSSDPVIGAYGSDREKSVKEGRTSLSALLTIC